MLHLHFSILNAAEVCRGNDIPRITSAMTSSGNSSLSGTVLAHATIDDGSK